MSARRKGGGLGTAAAYGSRTRVRRGVRRLAGLCLAALLVACSADGPEPAADPAPSDTARPAASRDSLSAGGADPRPAGDPEPNDGLLTPDGWGPLRIGMSRAEVVAAAGEDANPAAVGGPDPAACDEFRPARAPDGVLVMLRNGVLARISVSGPSEIATSAGFRVGDTGAAVERAYGGLARVEPHQYLAPPARYITAWRPAAGAEQRGIRYEIDSQDRIMHLRAGGRSIEAVEGCL